jgi:hypothetical protein
MTDEFRVDELGGRGIAVNPAFLVEFRGKQYGCWDQSLRFLTDGLAWQHGITLRKYDDWFIEHADETFTITHRATGINRSMTLGELHRLAFPKEA